MKSVFTIISFIALSMMSCENVSNKMSNSCDDCERFKNGKFKLTAKMGFDKVDFLIERKDSIQVESIGGKEVAKLHIKWTSPCSYESLLLETYPIDVSESMSKMKTNRVEINIISCTQEYYVIDSRKVNNKSVFDTLWVME